MTDSCLREVEKVISASKLTKPFGKPSLDTSEGSARGALMLSNTEVN